MEQNKRQSYRNRYSNPQEIKDPTGKLPPRDTELEEVVLGALMIEKDAYMEVCDILTPESFYDPVHQKIYEAISQLGFNQKPIDLLTVTEQLRQNGELDNVGGALYVTQLTARVISGANVQFHARIIAQKFLARRLITFASKVESMAFDESNDVDDLLNQAEGELFEISQTQLKREVMQIDPVLNAAVEQIQAAANRESGLSGLPSGFTDIDRITSGWQNSDLIIIAARPAMGKTAFVLSMAKNMAIDNSIPVAIFSLEMSNVQLINRIISNACEIEGGLIKSGRLSNMDWDRLNSRLRTLYGAPLYLDETPALSVSELRTKARRLVRERGVKMILIDYLQLMNASGMKFGNREQEVSTISRSLKALAKELNIPIVALSQLSRANEAREDKRPMLSDLRESGAIEQDADIVCFIHRQEYYNKSGHDAEGNDITGQADFIIAKHRSGSTDTVTLRFKKDMTRFEDLEAGYRAARAAVEEASQDLVPSKIFGPPADSPDGFPDIMPDKGEPVTPF